MNDQETLLRRYFRSREAADRERLIHEFLPLARTLAYRYRSSSEPIDDLIQVASLGLVKALDRYDPGHGTPFQAYAVPTILGELRRHFRDRVLPVHLPRGIKERTAEMSSAIEQLTIELDRSPRLTEVAERLGLGEEEAVEGMQALAAARTVSLDLPGGGADSDGATIGEAIGASDPGFEVAEERIEVRRAFSALDPREGLVVALRFEQDLTQEEIAQRIGVSQVHVSRILRRALAKLRSEVQREPDSPVVLA
jgi:RNA polymerase sigma-B factor